MQKNTWSSKVKLKQKFNKAKQKDCHGSENKPIPKALNDYKRTLKLKPLKRIG